ncbi:MAG TPA: TetR/AcrR family transcriptional regulator [Terracidiphilus sp.]
MQTRRRCQTRAEILQTAFELFAKSGYDSVSMDTIAESAGVSRATLFNYFPQKELMLHDIAAARAEKLKSILSDFAATGKTPSFDDIVRLILKISEENARIGNHSKKLILETFFRSASQGLLLAAREEAVGALTSFMTKIVRRRKQAHLAAETLFAVYLATMLEWLMRDTAPAPWLLDTMRARLMLLREGIL